MNTTRSFVRVLIAFSFACVAALGATAQAGTYTASWTNGNNSGIWEQDGNWSTIAYPNNGHSVTISGNPYPDASPLYNVSITNAAPCTLGIGVNVQTVSTGAGTTLNLKDNVRLNVGGAMSVAGLVTLNSTGNGSHLRLGDGSGVANGGVIQMSDSGSNYISGVGDRETFTVASGGTIRGAGQMNLGYFGGDQHLLNYVNHGLIDATQPKNALQIGLGGQTGVEANLTNDGTLRASANGTLRIHAFNTFGTVTNTGGVIRAQDNGTVRVVNGVTVQGGTLATTGSGTIRGDSPGGGGGTFKDVTNTGMMAIADSESIGLAGTFTNNNLLRVDSTPGNGATLMFSNGTTVTGTGAVSMSASGNNYVYGTSDGAVVTIAAGATIQGGGTINPGFQSTPPIKCINHGLINANLAAYGINFGTYVSGQTDTNLTNDGTLRASNGSTLRFHSFNVAGAINNAGGVIEALDSSFVRIAPSVTVDGGTLRTEGSGSIRGDVSGHFGGILKNVTNNGTIASGSGEIIQATGSLTNNGAISLDSSGGLLVSAGDLTLGGPGTVSLSGGSPTGIAGGDQVGRTLTVQQGATIRGAGQIGTNNSNFTYKALNVVNNGTIEASGGALVDFIANYDSCNLTNQGTLRALANATFQIIGSNVVPNSGTIEVPAGATMRFDSGATLANTAGGVINVDGDLVAGSGIDLNGGQLIGNGTIDGDIRNAGGVISPGHSPGKLTINGNYTQGADGTLTMEIGGTDAGTYDQLVVSGTATLGGTLNIVAINGFTPKQGDVYTLVSAASFGGSFASINISGFTGKVDVSSSGVRLTVTTNARQLLNISTRMEVLTGENVLIGGFIVTGTEPKKVLVRGLGPELPVAGQLQDPVLELHKGDTVVATNDNWRDSQEQEIKDTTVPPTDDRESAIVQTLQPGSYTAVLSGKSDGTGVGQVEVYDLGAAASSQLANISTRGFVDVGDNVMIGGVIIGGGSAGTTTRVLVRAIGPSLSGQGVGSALQDPVLELRDGNGQLVAQNDNWRDSQEQAIKDTTIPPSDDRESAIVQVLGEGNYTAIVRGKGNTTGIGLIELYNLQ